MSVLAVSIRGQWRAYLELTKPRITLLVLVTAAAGMWLASGGLPQLGLLLATLAGVGLAAASSSSLNNYLDREIDKQMSRTCQRALPAGRLRPDLALIWGIGLGVASFALLAATVNWLTALLALGTILFYVLIYTLWLKRRTPLCTSIGGIAGALPPLIGWSAITGGLAPTALALFAILFTWQPPHFWALALIRTEEYRQAGLPILPVARGPQVTKRQMVLYTLALLPVSLTPYWLGAVGPAYLGVTTLLGVGYLALTARFVTQKISRGSARQLFFYSLIYLSLLLIMVFADCRCRPIL